MKLELSKEVKEFLRKNNLRPYQLEDAAHIRRGRIYSLVRDPSAQDRITWGTIKKILKAIEDYKDKSL